MRRFLLALAIFLAVSAETPPRFGPDVGRADPAYRGALRIGTEAARPPFHFIDADKQLQGMEIEIAKAMCGKLGRPCEFAQIDWEELVPSLEAGRIDLIVSSMQITPARRARVWFTRPLYLMPWVYVGRRAEKPTELTSAALAGRAIGVVQNTPSVAFLAAHVPEATARVYAVAYDAALDLSHQRLDLVLLPRDVATTWLNETDEGACCHVVSEAPRDEMLAGRGIGIALRPRERDLRRQLDEALATIGSDGTKKEIVARYFLFDLW